MWGTKKPDLPAARPIAEPTQPASVVNPSATPPATSDPHVSKPSNWEATSMNTNDPTRPTTAAAQGTARLGQSLHVKGEITGNEDLHVDGSVEGLITLEDRKLTVGASAKLTADVTAREVVVFGSVKGNLRARDRIEIKKDGSVVGDLTTARIMIEDGAYFKGSIEIDRGESADAEHKTFARAAGKSE